MSWRDDPIAESAQRDSTPAGPDRSFQEAWRNDDVVEPSLSSKVGALGQGATGGAIEMAPAVAGAIAGAKLGSLAGPWGMAGGTVLGGLSGLFAGQNLRERASNVPLGPGRLTTPTVQDMPPELRPYGYAGEVIGGGGTVASVPLVAGSRGVQTASPFVNRVLDSAARNPRTFATAEGAGIAASAVGEGVAEAYAPGNTGARIGAGIVAGSAAPLRHILPTFRFAKDRIGAVMGELTQTGRENRAATILQNIVTQTGEDPAALAKALREQFPVNVTSAQRTGSPALIALEERLTSESAKFGAESRKMAKEGLDSIRGMIVALEGTGQPEAFKAAAEIRGQYFRSLLGTLVQDAETNASNAASKIAQGSPESLSSISKWANSALDNSLREARKVETELWNKIPREVPATATSILERHAQIRGQLLPEEPLPGIVEAFVARIGQTDGNVTSGELLRFRSRALQLAREAASKQNANEARIYGELAEASLDDLSAIADRTPGLNEARQFSRELNDTFGRTFAGDALGTKKTGADRIPPELMLRRAMGEGREAGALRFKQLQEALSFLPKRGAGSPEEMNIMLDAQARFLRESAAQAIDPQTGRVNTLRLSRFLENNKEMLSQFPDVRNALRDALTSEQGAQKIRTIATGADPLIEKKTAFGRVLKYDSPSDAVKNALSTPTPAKDFLALTKLAQRGGSEAVAGLKVATWEDAIRRSSTDAGGLSFQRLQSNLFNPVRPGQPSLAQMMKMRGLMSADELAKTEELIKRALTIENALASGNARQWEPLVGQSDVLFDLVARIGGAKLGTSVAQAMGPVTSGHGLIAASAGSKFTRELMEKIPQGKVKNVLIEAATNPQLAAKLLERPTTQAEGVKLTRQIHAYLIQAGILGLDDNQPSRAKPTPPYSINPRERN